MQITGNDSHRIKGKCPKCWNQEGCEVLHADKGKIQMANMRADLSKGKRKQDKGD